MRRASIALAAVMALAAGCGTAQTPSVPGDPTPTAAASPGAAATSTVAATLAPPSSPRPEVRMSIVPEALLGFTQLRRNEPTGPAAIEVGTVEQFDRFAGDLLAGTATGDEIRGRVRQYLAPHLRMFAFVLSGCQYQGAILVVTETSISAKPVGGEGVSCFVAEYFLAVLVVHTDRVPANAKVA